MFTGALIVIVSILKLTAFHLIVRMIQTVNLFETRDLVDRIEIGPVTGHSGQHQRPRSKRGNYIKTGKSGGTEQRSLFANATALEVR